MPVTGRLADIAQKSAVLLLAGTTGKLDITYIYINTYMMTYTMTVYYMVNVGMLVNRRMELKKQGKLHEELVSTLYFCSIDSYR